MSETHGIDTREIQSRAEQIWEQFKAEKISWTEFVAGIEALGAELPAGMTIRFA